MNFTQEQVVQTILAAKAKYEHIKSGRKQGLATRITLQRDQIAARNKFDNQYANVVALFDGDEDAAQDFYLSVYAAMYGI